MRSILWIMLLLWVCSGFSQVRTVDPTSSSFRIKVQKAGLFSFAGHDHSIVAAVASGLVDESTAKVEIVVNTSDLKVVDPEESEKNRVEIQETMLSGKCLDAAKYPTISFRSSAVRSSGANTYEVTGDLELHGQSRPVRLTVQKSGNTYSGSTVLKQTDFGITPVAVAGGTVKIKDEVKIEFKITAK